jgi:two-component system, OmpR family, response regulator
VTGARIIIAEDDPELRGLLRRGLLEEGFAPEAVATAKELLERVDVAVPDALVIDIGLPDADGRDACQSLRSRGIDVPVLFLTARDALPDRLAGFASGGDDYLTKPFELAELVARLRVQIRRSGATTAITVGVLTIDPTTHTASDGRSAVPLTPTEFRLLGLLASRPGEAVRRRELARVGWPHGAIVHQNTLDAYIARIRRKLRELPDGPAVETVHGVGYILR